MSKNNPDECDVRSITEDDTSLESSFTEMSHSNNSIFSNKGKYDVTPPINSQDVRKKDKSKMVSKNSESKGSAYVNLAFPDIV